MRSDIQDGANDKQDPEYKPERTTEIAKRPPVEHHRGQIQNHVRDRNLRSKRIPELDLYHVVDPIPKGGEKDKEEASYPVEPVFPTAQEHDADDSRWNTKGIHHPSVLECIALKQGPADGEMDDERNLKEEGPGYEQPVQTIKLVHVFSSKGARL